MNQTLAYLYGEPAVVGQLKVEPEDFIVKEDLGFELTGEGEHLFLKIRKKGCNTLFVLDKLAAYLNLSPKLISYAGLKDRHAVTEQWFSLHIPGKIDPDMSGFQLDGVEIIESTRHNKKLKIGALKGNFFKLNLVDVNDVSALEQRIELVKHGGFPNYFGDQRFGHDNHNITQAKRWALGEIKVKDRKKRSFFLSAVRSFFFNQIASQRIQDGKAFEPMNGDALQLIGSHSYFTVKEEPLEQLKSRIEDHDLITTAPLMGDGQLGSDLEALVYEQSIIDSVQSPELLELLKKERLQVARRAIIIYPNSVNYDKLSDSRLSIEFWLPSGVYATSLVRELMQFNEIKE